MVKQILALAVALAVTVLAPVSAEQAAAEQYQLSRRQPAKLFGNR